MTGEVLSHYKFDWDAVTTVVVPTAANKVFVGGRVTGSATTASAVANCRVEPALLVCKVKSFLNTNFLGSSYSPLTGKILYVGKSNNFATATVIDSIGVLKETNYYFTLSGLSSVAFLRAVSPPSFVGAFVAGTGASGVSTQRIIAGWIRMDTGDLHAMSLVPLNGVIMNSDDLVLSMTLDFTGPDSYIGGALELSDSPTPGKWGYLLRANALYKTVRYCVRFVSYEAHRRLLGEPTHLSGSVVRAMTRVDNTLYIIVDGAYGDQSTTVTVVKVDAASGSIDKQVTISAVNASITCTDITSAGKLLDLTCMVHRLSTPSPEAHLISANRDLSFSRRPDGFIRDDTALFSAEDVVFFSFGLSAVKRTTTIDTLDTTIVVSGQEPTCRPTLVPSAKPSKVPSNIPSAQPTSSPTSAPSVSPQPTSAPSTSGPTNTHKPTAAPTTRPTSCPSVTVTPRPSVGPTVTPTVRPTTSIPSVLPTLVPSASPTRAPVPRPSSKPTVATTARPSSVPTVAPSAVTGEVGSDDNNSSETASYVIAVSVTGSVLLVCLCAFLFYQRHELRVEDIQKKITKEALSSAEPSPTWLPHDARDVLQSDASDSGDDCTRSTRSVRMPAYSSFGANHGRCTHFSTTTPLYSR